MKRLLILAVIFICIGTLSISVSAAEIRNEDSITIQDPVEDDSFLTGQNIQVKAPIVGELFAAGKDVEISARPTRSLFAAGNTVRITEGAGYNVFTAGNTITISGTIEHDVFVAGKSITLEPNTHIKGSLRVGGTLVKLAGKIDGDVNFSSQRMESNAVIGKTVKGDANLVTFSGGRIGGDLIYNSNSDASGLESVEIVGKTERSPIPANQTSRIQTWLLGALTAFIMGAALLLLLPTKISDLSFSLKNEWVSSFLVGLGTFVLSPIAIILLFSSVVAWPLALIWAVLFIIMIYIVFIIGEIIVGMYVLKRFIPDRSNWWIALILGIIIISLIRLIPAVGSIILLVLFIGINIPLLGATLLWWKKRLGT